jgi:hypothetical protein
LPPPKRCTTRWREASDESASKPETFQAGAAVRLGAAACSCARTSTRLDGEPMGFRVGERLAHDLARDAAALEPGRDFRCDGCASRRRRADSSQRTSTFHLGLEAACLGVVAHFDGSVGGRAWT